MGTCPAMPAAPQGARWEESGESRVETEHGVGGRKGRKEVAGPRLRTALHPSPSGARAQQSQFRGGKSVSNLSADLYFLRAFWLMKT